MTLSASNTLVGVGRTLNGTLVLDSPAPTGGVTITLDSIDPAIVDISPSMVTVNAGELSPIDPIVITGVGTGTTTVTASATGFETALRGVAATPNFVSVPTTLNVALGQTTAFPVQIAPDPAPAPAGGIVVTVESSDPGLVEVVTATITIPEGAITADATPASVTLNVGFPRGDPNRTA